MLVATQPTATLSIESLAARVSALEAQINRTEQQEEPQTATPAAVTPFWECISMVGFAHTTGSDFSGDFTGISARDEAFWTRYNQPTGSGGFSDGRHTTDDPVSASYSITWHSENSGTVEATLSGVVTGTFTVGKVQVIMNGYFLAADTEFDADVTTAISLKVKKGENRLVICYSNIPDTVTFKAVLWDETRGDRWVDPRAQKRYTR